MLGVGAGRFTVSTSTTAIEAQLDGNLAAQLAKPIARARAATAILNGAGSPGQAPASRVVLDEPLLEDYLRAMPELARRIAMRIADGTPPRALVLEGACEASLVQDIVCDLASRGIVVGIDDEDGNDLLGPEVTRFSQHTDTRASFAPRTATPSPVPACKDDGVALCESPEPGDVRRTRGRSSGGSLEDAVMHEIAFASPVPAQLGLPLHKATAQESPLPSACEDEGTPPHDQIIALSEATVVDNTSYAERESAPESPDASIPIEEASISLPLSESRAMKTPLTAVTTRDDAAGLPAKRKAWPMVAFIAASGIVAWAVLHFSAASASKHVEVTPPPPPALLTVADGVTYSNVPTEIEVSTGQGLLEISAPGDAVILVDGSERGRGGATLPLWSGMHDVRMSGAEGEQGRAVEVRAGRVAHLKF